MLELDKRLFLDMVSFYGQLFGLTPLAAKVYVYLMFDFKREGIPFDELTEIFKVSKSSMSSSLQNLLHNNHIEYVSSIDSRKRLFRTNTHYPYIRFNEVLENLQKERDLISRFLNFKSSIKCREKDMTGKLSEYVHILDEHIGILGTTLSKLK
ncbi:MAG: hypothetical protein BGN92_00935 [Sphingobacteriales bacterium 41-5]|nr:MAG: hypothetical protein BGN92_00935 [Sphingobacteriales bacterium 41-5]